MSNFKLINPTLKGNIKTTVTAHDPLDAAKEIWTHLSKYFTNDVPSFAFTIENQDAGDLHHFKVQEKKQKNEASFKIEAIDSKLKAADLKKFKSRIDNLPAQKGGKKHDKKKDDDDSSSSSSSEFDALRMYKNFSQRTLQPILYWYYDPNPYYLETFFVPTFIQTIVPYVEIVNVGYYVY